mgnify:CR=1 FL=1|jgi:hypothetical protein|tara:strand:+ start:818 stop:1042 length:225 start_codon:yes stop_codon:yes gene_type:complete
MIWQEILDSIESKEQAEKKLSVFKISKDQSHTVLKRKQDYQFHKEDLKKTHYFVPSNQFLIIEIEEDPLIGQTT